MLALNYGINSICILYITFNSCSIAETGYKCLATFWAFFGGNRSCKGWFGGDIVIHELSSVDVTTIKLNKWFSLIELPGMFEFLLELFLVTERTHLEAGFSTESKALVLSTLEHLCAALIAWWSVTDLMAALLTAVVRALPGARLCAWLTAFAAVV